MTQIEKIEQSARKYIEGLNTVTQKEWNGRFKIEFQKMENERTLVVTMYDTKAGVAENGYTEWSKVFKGTWIWEVFNNFVFKRLEDDKDERNRT